MKHSFQGYALILIFCCLASSSTLGLVLSGSDSHCVIDSSCSISIFEDLYDGWSIIYTDNQSIGGFNPVFSYEAKSANGNALGSKPAEGAYPGQEPITGYQGKYLVNSKRRNLGSFIGELRSANFEIKGDVIDFLIGGGAFGEPTSLNLYITNRQGAKKVRQATGNNSSRMIRKSWDVSEFKDKMAYLQILDYAPCEPFGYSGTVSFEEDNYGFILVDDIRQLNAQGNRIAAKYDADHNFDFETIKPAAYVVTALPPKSAEMSETQIFDVKYFDQPVGRFIYKAIVKSLEADLFEVEHTWNYSGKNLTQVKFELKTNIPIKFGKEQYYILPGLLYNGNPIGQAAHYLYEDFPEDTMTMPAGYSVEDQDRVFGGWVKPQASRNDAKVSVSFQKDQTSGNIQIIHKIPESAQFGRWFSFDKESRLTITDGFSLSKRFYYYLGTKERFKHISKEKTGFRQVLDHAWETLYPKSPENPPHSLQDDYQLKMSALLNPYALLHNITVNQKNYYIWMVARWILPEDFEFTNDEVPMEYFHPYTGFSWSGMMGLSSYNAFKEYLRSNNQIAFKAGMDTMDLFVENAISPSGILYPAWYLHGGFSSLAGPGVIDVGHLGEGLFWYIQCYKLLSDNKIAEKKRWLEVVQSSLDIIMKVFPDGEIPGRFDSTDFKAATRGVNALYWVDTKYTDTWFRPGKGSYPNPSQGGPTNFSLFIWPCVSYYQLTGKQAYLDYAIKMGDLLINIINKYGVLSGMEVDFFNVDMRMSHAACKAFNHLYEATTDEKWLEAAEVTGALLASWMNCYNINFEGYEDTPLGHFDYRSVGGIFVDIKLSAPMCCFQQAATELLKLWSSTGDKIWFERARATLLNGTQVTLTEEKRQWMNRFHQGPADNDIARFNPNAEFDPHTIGGGTENVLQGWPVKGRWTTRSTAIISMFMLAEGFDWDDIRKEYGSITYHGKWQDGGALDSLDQVTFKSNLQGINLTARNMLDSPQTYPLRLLRLNKKSVLVDGKNYTDKQIRAGIPLRFGPQQKRTFNIQW